MTDSAPMQDLKLAAARRAADWIRDGMIVGLGTGSTVRPLLQEIADRLASGALRDIRGVPTSEDTRRRAETHGIPLGTLDEHPSIDLTIDGADEVDPDLRLVKGLGGALLREKIVAVASAEMMVIVDESKLVARLGTRAPLPVEVDPFGAAVHERFLRGLGADPVLRLGDGGAPFRTDGGHFIFDCRFPHGIEDPEALDLRLCSRPGIVESGLFLGIARRVVVARASGVEIVERPEGEAR